MTMTDRRSAKRSRWNCRARVFLMSGALVLAGCVQPVIDVGTMQKQFGDAARAENELRINRQDYALDPALYAAKSSEVTIGYTQVVTAVKDFDPRARERLRADRLWGTVLTIVALSQWRLHRYADMATTISQYEALDAAEKLPRDKGLIEALPGLAASDQAHAVFVAPFPGNCEDDCREAERERRWQEIKSRIGGGSGAIARIESARKSLQDADHPLHVYLIQSQLIAYTHLLKAAVRAEWKREMADEVCAAYKRRQELERVVETLGIEPAAQTVLLKRVDRETGADVNPGGACAQG